MPRVTRSARPPLRPAPATRGAGELRLIGGQWKRSRLPIPDSPGLRPTPDRVRETLFNWLGQDLSGWRCLDAFAGSGALGFEAASRGATEVVLLERDPRLAASLRSVQQRLGATQLRIEVADALAWMAARIAAPFDLVLLDPPFDAGLAEPALDAARLLLTGHGFLYLETDSAFDAGACAARGLRLHRHLHAGRVHAHLMRPIDTAA
ncbi:16S rRNA (guanine(966)-N(2))-methyltransferase RsmD [uncultured Methylibium sp.]|uniref:16S rRNA (guanine(966)-N(2))-methyltransferase RsmD n=1 Tax=uncultured Methylibium sp. TaxID=381093 RepID=UPI0025F2E74A|nr:16S rRNA (guanine(966)-N(2))-methyltransferase RsmD [uncultured Methylibium sp.]